MIFGLEKLEIIDLSYSSWGYFFHDPRFLHTFPNLHVLNLTCRPAQTCKTKPAPKGRFGPSCAKSCRTAPLSTLDLVLAPVEPSLTRWNLLRNLFFPPGSPLSSCSDVQNETRSKRPIGTFVCEKLQNSTSFHPRPCFGPGGTFSVTHREFDRRPRGARVKTRKFVPPPKASTESCKV